jgi:regulator of cell morphogenesis and NO signaling
MPLGIRSARVEDTTKLRDARALIDHILERYHRRHREQLAELTRLARAVEHRHAARPHCPTGIAEQLCVVQQAIESHMRKEEQVLFPLIAQGAVGTAAPIAVMRMEHEQHHAALDRLGELTHNMIPPTDACGTWRALYAGLRTFRDDLVEHMRLENDILFAGACGATK